MTVHHYSADEKLLQTEFYSPDFILLKVTRSDGVVFYFDRDGITLVSIKFPDGRIIKYFPIGKG